MTNTSTRYVVSIVDGLQTLLEMLCGRGCRVLGPAVRDQDIAYDEFASVADLPRGSTDDQEGERYRRKRRDDHVLSGYAVGSHSWTKVPHPPVLRWWRTDGNSGACVVPEPRSERLLNLNARTHRTARIPHRTHDGSTKGLIVRHRRLKNRRL